MIKRNKSESTLYVNICFSFVCFAFFIIYFFMQINLDKSIIVYSTFLIIGLFSLFQLCSGKNFINFSKFFYAFSFIFFCIAPLSQYNDGISLWSHVIFTDSDYLIANTYIIISLILFYLFSKIKIFNFQIQKEVKSNYCPLLFFSIINIIVLLYCYKAQIIITSANISNDSIMSFVEKIIRFFPVGTLLIYIFNYKKNLKKDILFLFITCSTILILFFPLTGSIPRFMLFGTYIILFYELLKKIKIPALFPLLLVIGFFVVFPSFNFFKAYTIFELNKFTFDIQNITNTVDFDAYQLFMESIKYVDSKGMLFGKNILTGVLFFIPRSIRTSKLNYSGQLIAEYYNASFTNLSCPYIGEFYLAFGPIGILLFSSILGIISRIIDNNLNSKNSLFKGLSLIYCCLSIYILRGSFLPTFSFTSSLAVSFILAYIIQKISFRLSVSITKINFSNRHKF